MQGLEEAWNVLGSKKALAKALNISPSTISMWLKRQSIPPHQVKRIEKVSGVPREILSPELFDRS